MTKKKATKKTSKKKSFKDHKSPKPVRVPFGPGKKKHIPEFEQALAEEARSSEIREQKELDDYVDPSKSRGAEDQPESTIPPNAVKAVAPVLKIPFAICSNIKEIPEIRLTNEEAQEWAVPIVDLLEYYFPGKVPEIAWMWLTFLTSTAKVIDSRIEIVHQKKTAVPAAGKGPSESLISPGQTAHLHNGADPANEYPEEQKKVG